jgi:hypothetical protein
MKTITINIIKNGVVSNSCTQEESKALAWLSEHEGQGNFGQKASTSSQQVEISPAVLDSEGVEIVPAEFETRIVEVPGYVVEIIDITEKLEQEKVNAAALQFLAESDWYITRQVETGVVCPVEIIEARATARASIVR